jgi:hypothetical protein
VSANHPARPESGVLAVGGVRHEVSDDATSDSRPTQDLKSDCHSSVLQRPPGALAGGAAYAVVGASTDQEIVAIAAITMARNAAPARRPMSCLSV